MGDFFRDRQFRLIISQSQRVPHRSSVTSPSASHRGAPTANAVSSRASSCAPSLPLPTTQQPQFCLSVRIPWTLRIRKWRRRLPLRWQQSRAGGADTLCPDRAHDSFATLPICQQLRAHMHAPEKMPACTSSIHNVAFAVCLQVVVSSPFPCALHMLTKKSWRDLAFAQLEP